MPAELLGGSDMQQQQQQQAPPAQLAAQMTGGGGGMFDGLDLANARSGGLAHPAAPAAQQQPPQNGGSLFGGLAVAGQHSAPESGSCNHDHQCVLCRMFADGLLNRD